MATKLTKVEQDWREWMWEQLAPCIRIEHARLQRACPSARAPHLTANMNVKMLACAYYGHLRGPGTNGDGLKLWIEDGTPEEQLTHTFLQYLAIEWVREQILIPYLESGTLEG